MYIYIELKILSVFRYTNTTADTVQVALRGGTDLNCGGFYQKNGMVSMYVYLFVYIYVCKCSCTMFGIIIICMYVCMCTLPSIILNTHMQTHNKLGCLQPEENHG